MKRVADQVFILHKGRLVLDAAVDTLRRSYQQIDLVFPIPPDESYIRIAECRKCSDDGATDENYCQRRC